MNELLEPKQEPSRRQSIEANVASYWSEPRKKAHADANPIKPQRIFRKLSPLLPDHIIIFGDRISIY